MTIMKRLLVPLLLLGLALLPSGISAALQSSSPSTSDVLPGLPVTDLQGAVPTHGKPHSQKRSQDQDQDQDIDDDDKQKSEQTNATGGSAIVQLVPVAAVAPILSDRNSNSPLCAPVALLALDLAIGEEDQDVCDELGSEQSQATENVANNGIFQSNEDEQEQEGEAEQDQDQDQVNAG